MVEFFSYELPYSDLALFFLVAFFVGMSKTGVHGIGMVSVPMLAAIFGGKDSSGLMLPMLIMADFIGVWYYHRHANWDHLKKLFPWAAVGIIIGTYVGNNINDELFRQVMGIIIFASLGIMIWMEKGQKEKIPNYIWFAALLGLLGGITTMVGNLAGSVMALYLLSMRLPKNQYIGTAAWFFLAVNVFKVPFHIFSWETIDLNSFLLDLIGLPFIAVGAVVGIAIVKKIPNKQYRWFIIIMTAVAAGVMVYKAVVE